MYRVAVKTCETNVGATRSVRHKVELLPYLHRALQRHTRNQRTKQWSPGAADGIEGWHEERTAKASDGIAPTSTICGPEPACGRPREKSEYGPNDWCRNERYEGTPRVR